MSALVGWVDRRAIVALGVLIAIVATPLGPTLASTMVGHVLIQIPLLAAVGFVLAKCLEPKIETGVLTWNAGGIPGVLLASFAVAFWMIPRWLDGAVTSTAIEAAKYGSVVLLVGVPLGWSWDRLHPIARGVVKIEFLAMLFRLGWLYLISPDRFCSNYLLTDQVWLGRGLVIVGVALCITWLIPLFFGEFAHATPRKSNAVVEPGAHHRDSRSSVRSRQ